MASRHLVTGELAAGQHVGHRRQPARMVVDQLVDPACVLGDTGPWAGSRRMSGIVRTTFSDWR